MHDQIDYAPLGIHRRQFTDTPDQQQAVRDHCLSMGTRMNRSAVTPSEWLWLEAACNARPHGRYLEIGVYRHVSTCAFIRAMMAPGNDATLTTCDLEYRFPRVAAKYPDILARWTKLTGSSLDVLPTLDAAEPFDVIFVDGLHSDLGVRSDTTQARRLLAPGGVIIWHDANSPHTVRVVLEQMAPESMDFMSSNPDHCKGFLVYPKGWPDA